MGHTDHRRHRPQSTHEPAAGTRSCGRLAHRVFCSQHLLAPAPLARLAVGRPPCQPAMPTHGPGWAPGMACWARCLLSDAPAWKEKRAGAAGSTRTVLGLHHHQHRGGHLHHPTLQAETPRPEEVTGPQIQVRNWPSQDLGPGSKCFSVVCCFCFCFYYCLFIIVCFYFFNF